MHSFPCFSVANLNSNAKFLFTNSKKMQNEMFTNFKRFSYILIKSFFSGDVDLHRSDIHASNMSGNSQS